MSLGLPGNAVVVNFLMRFPVLVPIAAAVGISTVAIKEIPPALPPPVIQKIEVPPPPVPVPQPVVKPTPKPLEFVCPPEKDTTGLSKKEKQNLRLKGCKIKG
jgi:hypothetical protein